MDNAIFEIILILEILIIGALVSKIFIIYHNFQIDRLHKVNEEFEKALSKKMKCPKCGHVNKVNTYYELQNTFQYDCENCNGHVIIN